MTDTLTKLEKQVEERVANSPKVLQCIMTSLEFNGLEFTDFAEAIEMNNGTITTTVNNLTINHIQMLQILRGSSGEVAINLKRNYVDSQEFQLSYHGTLSNYSWSIGRATSIERDFRVKLEFKLDDYSDMVN